MPPGPHYSSHESWCSLQQGLQTRSAFGNTKLRVTKMPHVVAQRSGWGVSREGSTGEFPEGVIQGGGVHSSGLMGGQSCRAEPVNHF